MATYAELLNQIDELKIQAEERRQEEKREVVQRIREAIQVYGLQPYDLFGDAKPPKPLKPKLALGKRKRPIKYADNNGNAWSGAGRTPRWLLDYISKGRDKEEFRVRTRRLKQS